MTRLQLLVIEHSCHRPSITTIYTADTANVTRLTKQFFAEYTQADYLRNSNKSVYLKNLYSHKENKTQR